MLQFEHKIYEAQSIKNVQTVSHILIHNNQHIVVSMDCCLQVYSLSSMTKSTPSATQIIDLHQLLQKQSDDSHDHSHDHDHITSLLSKKTGNLAQQLFTPKVVIEQNLLLQAQHYLNRLRYIAKLRVTQLQCNVFGELLVVLSDGRACLLQLHSATVTHLYHSMVVGSVTNGCFVDHPTSSTVCLDVNRPSKLRARSLYILREQTATEYRLDMDDAINHMYALARPQPKSKDGMKVKVLMVTAFSLRVYELQKKKCTKQHDLHFEEYISYTQLDGQQLYLAVGTKLVSYQVSSRELLTLRVYQHISSVLLISPHESKEVLPIRKCQQTSGQHLTHLGSTSNGIYIGITSHRNHNYKDGRMVVIVPSSTCLVRQCLHNIIRQRVASSSSSMCSQATVYLDMKDMAFVGNKDQKKQIMSEMNSINRDFNRRLTLPGHKYQYEGLQPMEQDIRVLMTTISNVLEIKTHFTEKYRNRNRNQEVGDTTSRDIHKDRCIRTNKLITEEDIIHCQWCSLYAIYDRVKDAGKMFNCVACRNTMMPI